MTFCAVIDVKAVLLVLIGISASTAAQVPSVAERDKLTATAQQLSAEGVKLYQQGNVAEAVSKLRQALEVRRQLFPESQFPDGHPALVDSLNNVGVVLRAAGALSQALPYFEESLAMNRKLYPKAKAPDGHSSIATSLNNLGFLLESMGKHEQALTYLEQSLAMRQKLLPASKYPDGHPELAIGLGNVGYVLESMGKYEQARPYSEQALAMNRKLYPASKYPDGHPDLAHSLNNLAALHSSLGAQDEALVLYQQSLAMLEKLYPPSRFPQGHPILAASLNNVGAMYRALGAFEQAWPMFERALKMRRGLFPRPKFPNGHPDLALSLDNFAALCESLEQYDKALEHADEAREMRRKLYPESRYGNGHPELAVSLARFQSIHMAMQAYAKALPYAEQALTMRRKLYSEARFPNGHPDLASSLHEMAKLLLGLGETEKALPYCVQALEMTQRINAAAPRGHSTIADALDNLGRVYHSLGQFDEARPRLEESLAMRRRLHPSSQFPDGHSRIGAALNNLGAILDSMGDYEQAERYYQEALSMSRRLYPPQKYPNGHRNIADGLSNLGFLSRMQAKNELAIRYYNEALTMRRKLIEREIATMPEAEALAMLQALPRARDGYLAAAAQIPGTDAESARIVWESKALVTQAQAHRLAAVRAAGDEHKSSLTRLREIRRQIELLLNDPDKRPADRDRQVAALTDERDRLERGLANVLPRRRDLPSCDELGRSLPPGTVCIDMLAYTSIERDPLRKGRTRETATLQFVAFVFAKDKEVQRVDLGSAAPIVEAIRNWRHAIESRAASSAPLQLQRLAWAPIARQIPPGTHTIYLAPDGDLARIPWAALPGTKPDTLLLEEFLGGLAVVPHAPFLLDSLRNPHPAATEPEAVLALGGVAYDPPDSPNANVPYPALAGTVVEVNALRSQVQERPFVLLTGSEATWTRLSAELLKARYAHLATHGYFAEAQLSAERRRSKDQLRHWSHSENSTTVPITIARDPLAYSGLVLAHANRPTSQQHGLVTGLSLLDLPLQNLRLVTLSACETGLGELTAGEGVQGLQRAFHLAGCPNVVASLWKVNDAATAALMAKFYHEMWVKKKPPIEALREAQLTIYRHPELIPDLAGERGAVRVKEAVVVRAGEPSGVSRRVSDTKLWAAFVLSGVGK